MKNIFGRAGRAALRRISATRALLAFDYDGTLAPVVPDPSRAVMRARTRHLLSALNSAYQCVVISGRSRSDVLTMLAGTGIDEVVGSHGLEEAEAEHHDHERIPRWRRTLEESLGGYPGLVFEDKGFSLAVHYRAAHDAAAARVAIEAAASSLPGIRVLGGKLVVNVLPYGSPDKGDALERQRRRFACDSALFVGDDITDEDAFALGREAAYLTIRVGYAANSAAQFYVADQALVDDLLQLILDGATQA